MRKTLFLFAAAASGAFALAATSSRAAPLASVALDNAVAQAHAVRICEEDGDCWWTDGRHRGAWDERRDRWREGSRDRDDDYYGRAHRDRDWDRDDYYGERDRTARDRDDGRYGRAWDRDRDRSEWGRGAERDRYGMDDKDKEKDKDRERSARDESRDRDKETGSDKGVKEPGEQNGAQTEKKK